MAFTALLSFLFFLLCSHSAYAQGERLVVAYSSIGGSGVPVWIAEDKGFFGRSGLDVTLVYIGGGRIVAQAFAAGQIKIGVIAGPALVSGNLSGLNLRMVAGLVNNSTYSLFVHPNIKTVESLKGKNNKGGRAWLLR
jgi:NitT/TauT family transport system substrate-binding protein